MKLPAISIHAENLQLRTKVQLLETKLSVTEAKRKAQVGASFLLWVLIKAKFGDNDPMSVKAVDIIRKANGLPPKGAKLH